jgi:hypothetical protein
MAVSVPPVMPSGGVPTTGSFNFKQPLALDFTGMISKLTGMESVMTAMKSKMSAMQGLVMAVPKPMGVPLNIGTNLQDMVKSFTGITKGINDTKSMVTGFQSEWKADNLPAGSDISEGAPKGGQFGAVSGQNPGFQTGGGFTLPSQQGSKLI